MRKLAVFLLISLTLPSTTILLGLSPKVLRLEVGFPSGSIRLAGTLWLPEGAGPHPALVASHGSGRIGRDDLYQIQTRVDWDLS